MFLLELRSNFVSFFVTGIYALAHKLSLLNLFLFNFLDTYINVHCRYERFVIALEEALKDKLPNLKDKAMKVIATSFLLFSCL